MPFAAHLLHGTTKGMFISNPVHSGDTSSKQRRVKYDGNYYSVHPIDKLPEDFNIDITSTLERLIQWRIDTSDRDIDQFGT